MLSGKSVLFVVLNRSLQTRLSSLSVSSRKCSIISEFLQHDTVSGKVMDDIPGDNMVGRWKVQASQKTTNISVSLLLYT